MDFRSRKLEELRVNLDKLEYHYGGLNAPEETPHVFIYFITIRNETNQTIRLLGRKWIIKQPDGDTLVVEGDKIVGKEPKLAPGEEFSYNSFHLSSGDASAVGSYHGLDTDDNPIHALIPRFEMKVPFTES